MNGRGAVRGFCAWAPFLVGADLVVMREGLGMDNEAARLALLIGFVATAAALLFCWANFALNVCWLPGIAAFNALAMGLVSNVHLPAGDAVVASMGLFLISGVFPASRMPSFDPPEPVGPSLR